MTRKLLATLLILAFLICGIPLAATAEDPGTYSWTGVWKTSWGDMTLTQTGNKVSGTYTFDNGKIEGTVSGSTLTGTWSEAPSYAPPRDAGQVEFVMSADGKSFTGKWRYGSEGDWGRWDGGTRDAVALLEAPKDYSNASSWATTELDKASELGLIPDILKGADMTKPITREEFAELAVRLYETSTGIAAVPASPNPFPDTNNPEILKAYKLGVTTGITTAAGLKFAPKDLINREQCATMLYRALKAIAPGADYSITGVKDFPDQKNVSSWAAEGTKYMSKLGIIKGDNNGNFMPRATTSAQEATGYGAATREAAILMSVRSFEQMDAIKASKPAATPVPVPSPTPAPVATPAPSPAAADDASSVTDTEKTDETGSAELKDIDKWIIGIWTYSETIGNVGFVEIIEFKEDGTFEKGLGTIVKDTRSATGFKGNYKISGDKLILYNQLKSQSRIATSVDRNYWALIVGRDQYKDIPVDDFEYQISRTDDDKLSMSRVIDQNISTTIVLSRSSD